MRNGSVQDDTDRMGILSPCGISSKTNAVSIVFHISLSFKFACVLADKTIDVKDTNVPERHFPYAITSKSLPQSHTTITGVKQYSLLFWSPVIRFV